MNIGAGSAGCVVANRLGEDRSLSILVLEAGGSDGATIISMPSAFSIPMNTKRFNWGMSTEPEHGLDGRVIDLAKGKSSIEMATMDDLVPTLELVKKAVEAGELDAQVEAASIKLREGFGK